MSFRWIISRILGLSVLFSFLTLPTDCGQEKTTYVQVKIACTTQLNVNTQTGVDVRDAYVCKNAKVTWNANGHTFFVGFKDGCPFVSGCKEIDNQNPTAGPVKDGGAVTIYDYGIVVDGKLFDPHVIGGGA